MKTRRPILLALSAVACVVLAGCSSARTGQSAGDPGRANLAAPAAGSQRSKLGGLVVAVQSTAAPVPDAGPGVPPEPGPDKRWLSIVATVENPTDAAIAIGASFVDPYLTDADGHTIDSVFTKIGGPGLSGLSPYLTGGSAGGGAVPHTSSAPGLAPGGVIQVTEQWAVPANGHGFRFSWDLGAPGVARFELP